MIRKTFFLLLVCLIAGTRATASVIPTALLTRPFSEDTTLRLVTQPAKPPEVKKQGFFTRLKNKLLALALKPFAGSASTKKTLGWVSIGLFVLGIIVAFPLGAGAAGLFLILAGITTGIIALAKKGDPNDRKERRRSRTPAIIGVVLGVGLIVGLVIALAGAHF